MPAMVVVSVSVFVNALKVTFGIQWIGWIIAYLLKTETFYDILGGLNFLSLALMSSSSSSSSSLSSSSSTTSSTSTRCIVMTILFCISRSWLLIYLAWRAHSRKGDTRFDGVKDQFVLFGIYWTVSCYCY
jgi:hypothetical protein